MESPIICNLVIDKIAIQQILYNGDRYYGYVNLGINSNTTDVEEPLQAKSVLVFMVVALNGHWKVPIGYFFIESLNGEERVSLLEKALELLYDIGIVLHSLTFDGASVNLSMCTHLDLNFDLGKGFKLYFLNPVTNEKVFCF